MIIEVYHNGVVVAEGTTEENKKELIEDFIESHSTEYFDQYQLHKIDNESYLMTEKNGTEYIIKVRK